MTSGSAKTKEAIQTSTIVTFIEFRSHVIGKVNLLNLRERVLPPPPCVMCLARRRWNVRPSTHPPIAHLSPSNPPLISHTPLRIPFESPSNPLRISFESPSNPSLISLGSPTNPPRIPWNLELFDSIQVDSELLAWCLGARHKSICGRFSYANRPPPPLATE